MATPATKAKDTEVKDTRARTAEPTREPVSAGRMAVSTSKPGSDPSGRRVDTEQIERDKPLAEAVAQDKEGKLEGQLSPQNFEEVIGEHPETHRDQALRQAGDGTQSIWPPQPDPVPGPVTLGPDGTRVEKS